MILCKIIDSYFCADVMFAMKSKGLKETIGNYYSQLFVMEKGCFYVMPIPKKIDVMIAMKLFTIDVGTLEPSVVDLVRE